MTTIFLHGLDSSGSGTKGRYFATHFPDMLRPDFSGSLIQRMTQLDRIAAALEELIIVGSSFGGLMGACFCAENPGKVQRLIMLAPALNFSEYEPPEQKLAVETLLVIGSKDVVTPPEIVIPAAHNSFLNLKVELVASLATATVAPPRTGRLFPTCY